MDPPDLDASVANDRELDASDFEAGGAA
jgi:hypothetical protein